MVKKATKTTKVSAKAKSTKAAPKKVKSTKVDYYPNRMTVAVSAAAAVSLTLIALLATSASL